jgi:hypothetical protein
MPSAFKKNISECFRTGGKSYKKRIAGIEK